MNYMMTIQCERAIYYSYLIMILFRNSIPNYRYQLEAALMINAPQTLGGLARGNLAGTFILL